MNTTAMAQPTPRIALIDLARGLALVAMVIFHLAWDMSFLKFIATDIALDPGWRMLSHVIAASFLALAGLSLGLAHAKGLNASAFWRRVAVVGAAALVVTVATRIAMPDAYVLFGILHCIALGAIICMPLLSLPWWLPVGIAGIVAGLPSLLAATPLSGFQDALEMSALRGLLQHLGLTLSAPAAVDFVPIIPWLGFMLAGLGAGLWLARSDRADALAKISMPSAIRPLVWAGRNSLPIYLIHQPLLIGALMLTAWFAPGLTSSLASQAEATFRADCITQCRTTRSREICTTACACVLDELRRDPVLLSEAIGTRSGNDKTDAAIGEAARICFRRTQTP
ncbi:MAG: DUF1624 domain-containing protein [Bosea sp. (in: a-proteobacteria)]